MSSPAERSDALRRALADRGLRVRLEEAGSLAILHPDADAPLDWAAERHDIVRLARLHGFTHVAVEFPAHDGAGK